MKCFKVGRIRYIEFWLKHNSDLSKDIRFYIRWRSHDEIKEGFEFVGGADKTGYDDNVLIRHHNYPRTKNQKAIHQSRMSGLCHLSEVKSRW